MASDKIFVALGAPKGRNGSERLIRLDSESYLASVKTPLGILAAWSLGMSVSSGGKDPRRKIRR